MASRSTIRRYTLAAARAGLAFASWALCFAPEATACTTFCLSRDGVVVFGRNYDFEIGDGLLVVNKSGMAKTSAPLHYLVADRTGAAATIEFLNGKLVAHSGKNLPVRVLTNDTYERSLAEWKRHDRGGESLPRGRGSIERFIRASALVEKYARASSGSIVEQAFDVLGNVAQGPATQWSIVYDLTRLEVHFRTAGREAVRKVKVPAFDFSCRTPVRILDVNAALEGDVTARFADYTPKANLDLLVGSYGGNSFLRNVPRTDIEAVSRHPDSMTCTR